MLIRCMLLANRRRPPDDEESDSLLADKPITADPLATLCLALSLLTALLQGSDIVKDCVRDAGGPILDLAVNPN